MADALIIDACRTPRGIGKAGKGALAGIHPQQLGATVLRALAERNGINTADVDDIIWGTSRPARPAGRRPRPHVGARRRLRRPRQRRDARPLLRLGHHQREHRRRIHHVGLGGSGDRRRHRDDVDARPPRQRPVHDGRRQPAPARQASAVASGRLRRRHRDHGRHHAARRRRARAREPAARRACHQERPLRQEPGAGLSRGRHPRARPRGISAPADHARRARGAEAVLRGHCRLSRSTTRARPIAT